MDYNSAYWDAMERKEVYGTTGPRILVRFFGGWDYTADDLNSRQPAFRGYEKGVPMGGDFRGSGKAPTFMVYALRDVIGADLVYALSPRPRKPQGGGSCALSAWPLFFLVARR